MTLSPYLVIDLETTGLSPENNRILQLSAIYDDLKTPIKDLKKFDILIDWENEGFNIKYSNYALSINSWIFKELSNKSKSVYKILNPSDAKIEWASFIQELINLENVKKLTIAGKNTAIFDYPFLKCNGFSVDKFKHRVLDPGSMYFSDFGYIPDLSEINKLINRNQVSHIGLDDCLDVIYAIRWKLNI